MRESWGSESPIDQPLLKPFLQWVGHVLTVKDLPPDAEPEDLVSTVQWAREAKQDYLELMKGAFVVQSEVMPRWVLAILKLGRYGVASKVLVRLACDMPTLFDPMIVEAVVAPSPTKCSNASQESPLGCVLRRVAGGKAGSYFDRLTRIWNAADLEAHFRQTCPVHLSVHAEMQLVSFYDHNPQRRPLLPFIDVSKKS